MDLFAQAKYLKSITRPRLTKKKIIINFKAHSRLHYETIYFALLLHSKERLTPIFSPNITRHRNAHTCNDDRCILQADTYSLTIR